MLCPRDPESIGAPLRRTNFMYPPFSASSTALFCATDSLDGFCKGTSSGQPSSRTPNPLSLEWSVHFISAVLLPEAALEKWISTGVPTDTARETYLRASRTPEYTSVFKVLAGPFFCGGAVLACGKSPPNEERLGPDVTCPIPSPASSSALRHWALKAFAPGTPHPRCPLQNSRPRVVPPRNPSSAGSLGFTTKKKE